VLPFLLPHSWATPSVCPWSIPSPIFGPSPCCSSRCLLGVTKFTLARLDARPVGLVVRHRCSNAPWHFNRFRHRKSKYLTAPGPDLVSHLLRRLSRCFPFCVSCASSAKKNCFRGPPPRWPVPLQFFLIYRLVKVCLSKSNDGTPAPAAFAVPRLAQPDHRFLKKDFRPPSPARTEPTRPPSAVLSRLFFITFDLFPFQFGKTNGIHHRAGALEGASRLLWLFPSRCRIRALRLVGFGLLIAAVRPGSHSTRTLLEYHPPRRDNPFFNWLSLRLRPRQPFGLFVGRVAPRGRRENKNPPLKILSPFLFTPLAPSSPSCFLNIEKSPISSGAPRAPQLDLPIQRQLRPRHDLLHRLGAVSQFDIVGPSASAKKKSPARGYSALGPCLKRDPP